MSFWQDLGALFTPSEKTKLAGVDTGAADDQTGVEIKALYEAEANAYTDGKNTKLAGVDAGADVTGSNPPQAHGASVHTDRTRRAVLTSPHYTTGGRCAGGVALDPATDESIHYQTIVPQDFSTLGSIKVVWMNSSSETTDKNWYLDVNFTFGDFTTEQLYSAHNNNDNGNAVSVPAYAANFLFLTTLDNGLLSNITKNDIIRIAVKRDADHASDNFPHDVIVKGIVIEYTADM